MANIITAEQLPLGEKLYFKKDIFGYRIVHPIRNEDGSFNWTNIIFGGKRNFVMLIIFLIIAGYVMWSYHHDVNAIQQNYIKISADPIGFCRNVNNNPSAYLDDRINWSKIEVNE